MLRSARAAFLTAGRPCLLLQATDLEPELRRHSGGSGKRCALGQPAGPPPTPPVGTHALSHLEIDVRVLGKIPSTTSSQPLCVVRAGRTDLRHN